MILDTSILIEILDGNKSIKSSLEKLNEVVLTTAISKYELLKAPKNDDANNLLDKMDIHDFDSRSSERSAIIYKELKKKGKMINELDILIASIAITHDELLITRDKDFKNIDNLKLLIL